jgi:copper chaperone CopZ
METRHLEITGMTCGHCVMAVKKSLSQLPGVDVQDVRVGSATVTYDPARVTAAMLEAAVEAEGYAVIR